MIYEVKNNKKGEKKISKILLIFNLFLCGIVNNINNSYALEDNVILSTTTDNEYTGIVNRLNEIEVGMKQKSISNDDNLMKEYVELKKLKNDYPKYIEFLKSKTEIELIAEGWNQSQIYAIQNYDGSEEMTQRAAASFSGTLKRDSYSYNQSTNQTRIKIIMSGQWSGVPLVKGKDHVLLAIKGSTANFNRVSSKCTVTPASGSSYDLVSSCLKIHMMKGVQYTFGITDSLSSVFKQVVCTYEGAAQGNVKVYSYLGAYVHYTAAGTSEISVSGDSGGNIGLGFSVKNTNNLEWCKVIDVN